MLSEGFGFDCRYVVGDGDEAGDDRNAVAADDTLIVIVMIWNDNVFDVALTAAHFSFCCRDAFHWQMRLLCCQTICPLVNLRMRR